MSGQLQTTQVGAVGTTTANVVRQQKAQATAAAAKELLFDEDEKGFEVVEEETVIKKKTKTMTGGQGANTYQRGRPQQGYWQNRGSQPGRGGNQRGGNQRGGARVSSQGGFKGWYREDIRGGRMTMAGLCTSGREREGSESTRLRLEETGLLLLSLVRINWRNLTLSLLDLEALSNIFFMLIVFT